MSASTITVIIPTYNRADCVRRNLSLLMEQTPRPAQVIVVDASLDDRTQAAVAEFPMVTYRRNADGRGNTPSSRNSALLEAQGNIIAFLDDDAFVRPGWCHALLESYQDESVGGVAGRALNGVPGEGLVGAEEIGKFRSDGTLTGNFACDPGKTVDVDHMIGCNMSLRREVIARLGGFRDDFRAGPFGICEETEICIRARRLGYRLVFNPAACADHIGAPQPGGRRFSAKYSYYHARNNLVMVVRNYGFGVMTARHLVSVCATSAVEGGRKIAGAFGRLSFTACGLIAGLSIGSFRLMRTGVNPIREDEKGQVLTKSLGRGRTSCELRESRNSGHRMSEIPEIQPIGSTQ